MQIFVADTAAQLSQFVCFGSIWRYFRGRESQSFETNAYGIFTRDVVFLRSKLACVILVKKWVPCILVDLILLIHLTRHDVGCRVLVVRR